MNIFNLSINKKLAFFMFKHKLTCSYKDDLLSPSNRFLASNSGFWGFWGNRENESIRQMLKISYILIKKQFLNNLKKNKDMKN